MMDKLSLLVVAPEIILLVMACVIAMVDLGVKSRMRDLTYWLTMGTLALPPLVIEGLAEFNGSFERLCLKAGTAAIEAMLAADAEQFCGKRYQRHIISTRRRPCAGRRRPCSPSPG